MDIIGEMLGDLDENGHQGVQHPVGHRPSRLLQLLQSG
jgi:hypothetical protein